MKLRNKRRLFALFKEFDVDIVLHGHCHESKEYFRKGTRFLNAGATIKNNKHDIKVNFLNLAKAKIDVYVESLSLPSKLKDDSSSSNKREYIKLVSAALVS